MVRRAWCEIKRRPGIAGVAVNDVAIVDLAQPDADRLILQRATHEMDAWRLSDFFCPTVGP